MNSRDYQAKKWQTGKLYSPGYVDNCLTAIKSWAASQEKPIIRKIRIENAQATPI
ncbi:MAG: hypothetical protein ACYCQJ_10150 [Nitrososphaerales archaeon]